MMTPKPFHVYIITNDDSLFQFVHSAVESLGGVTERNPKLDVQPDHRCKADLVLADIDSLSSNDLDTLIEAVASCTETGVLALGHNTSESAERASQALLKGIFDAIVLPDDLDREENSYQFTRQVKRILSLWRTTINLNRIQLLTQTPEQKPKVVLPQKKVDLIVVASSTGGPNVLRQILMDLSPTIGVPILCVQHIPGVFSKSLAEGLNQHTPWRVVEAESDMSLEPNVFYLAPGGKHMQLAPAARDPYPYRISLTDDPPVNHCRPAADVLFESVAKYVSGNILAVVLTGMGEDGRRGVEVLKQKNTLCITQSQADCVVYGMPRAIVQSGLSDAECKSTEMGAYIESLFSVNA